VGASVAWDGAVVEKTPSLTCCLAARAPLMVVHAAQEIWALARAYRREKVQKIMKVLGYHSLVSSVIASPFTNRA
jgi:hypothetical protein